MIQKLGEQIVSILRLGLQGEIPDPTTHIVLEPVSDPNSGDIPLITFAKGELATYQIANELSSSQPRPQSFQQSLAVDTLAPQGPYALDQTPLEGSMLLRVVYDKDTLTERSQLFQENKEYTIDYTTGQLTVSKDISDASDLLLTYSFVGIFTIKEFQQNFLMTVYSDSTSELEILTSLCLSMISTNHDELLTSYNQTDKTVYSANDYVSEHSLSHIQLLKGQVDFQNNILKEELHFLVKGQIKSIKTLSGGFGLIEKVHSPGIISDHAVDVEPNLG